jgi:hypothetical protein
LSNKLILEKINDININSKYPYIIYLDKEGMFTINNTKNNTYQMLNIYSFSKLFNLNIKESSDIFKDIYGNHIHIYDNFLYGLYKVNLNNDFYHLTLELRKDNNLDSYIDELKKYNRFCLNLYKQLSDENFQIIEHDIKIDIKFRIPGFLLYAYCRSIPYNDETFTVCGLCIRIKNNFYKFPFGNIKYSTKTSGTITDDFGNICLGSIDIDFNQIETLEEKIFYLLISKFNTDYPLCMKYADLNNNNSYLSNIYLLGKYKIISSFLQYAHILDILYLLSRLTLNTDFDFYNLFIPIRNTITNQYLKKKKIVTKQYFKNDFPIDYQKLELEYVKTEFLDIDRYDRFNFSDLSTSSVLSFLENVKKNLANDNIISIQNLSHDLYF